MNEVPDWREEALCAQVDTEIFFPKQGKTSTEAKFLCRRCPENTKAACLDWALEHHEVGIWGGMSERERRAERVRRQVVVPVHALFPDAA